MALAATTTVDGAYLNAGLVIAAVTVGGMLATARGRRLIGRMFRGQSIEQIASVSADRVAAVESAYNVLAAENKRLREESDEKIRRLEDENRDLRSRVVTLEHLVTAKTEIDSMSARMTEYHEQNVKRLDELLMLTRRGP